MAKTIQTKYLREFHSKMCQLQVGDRFCDITVHVDKKVFKCHRVVLCSASEYFNSMFNGNFCESSSKEVSLDEIDADVFEVVLKFIYTGKATLSCSNIYDIFRAADFYKLPHLIELCAVFIRKNLNTLADDILTIFWYARSARMKKLVGLLRRYIYENFGYFSNAPEFVELDVDSLLEILEVGAKKDVLPPQDVFFEGIYAWITRQEYLNPEEKKSCWDRLLKKMDATNLSAEYIRVCSPDRMALLTSQDGCIDGCIDTPGVLQCPKLLHAYVRSYDRTYDRKFATETDLFTGFSNSSPSSWIHSGKVQDCFSSYMETVVVSDRLYCYGYSSWPLHANPQGTFRCSFSPSMNFYTPLSVPPFTSKYVDLCGTASEIYAYQKSMFCLTNQFSSGSVIDRDQLSRNLFLYKPDIDKWLPLPRSKFEVSYASMTCDERGRLYLIGGSFNCRLSNSVQAYDVRTPKWLELSPTHFRYCGASCSMYRDEVFVVGTSREEPGEMYDPASGISRPLSDNYERHLRPKVVNWSDRVVYYDQCDTRTSTCSCYWDNDWITLPNIIETVKSVDRIPPCKEIDILSMVTF